MILSGLFMLMMFCTTLLSSQCFLLKHIWTEKQEGVGNRVTQYFFPSLYANGLYDSHGFPWEKSD